MTYKVVDSDQLDADITTVANAIRNKGGTSEPLAFPVGFVSAIKGIQSGGAVSTVSIYVEDMYDDVYYWNADGNLCTVASGEPKTIEALGGIIIACAGAMDFQGTYTERYLYSGQSVIVQFSEGSGNAFYNV